MSRLLIVFLVLSCCKSAVAESPVKRLYVFGDSYSDIGRGWPDVNGPTAVAYLAKRLGLVMVPSNARDVKGKSLNFAVSGAQTGENPGRAMDNAVMNFGMKNQVAEFVGMVKSGRVTFDPGSTVFFIAGGLNDGNMQTEETVANLESEMETLYGVGARRFRVAILPEGIPQFHNVGARLNPALAAIPTEMRSKFPDSEIETSRWGAFFDEVLRNGTKYGLTNTTDPCAGRSISHEAVTPCATPETHFYYHVGHPSTATDKVVGDMLYDEMVGTTAAR